MYVAVPTQSTCAKAWLAATQAVSRSGDEAYNVVMDVATPAHLDDGDHQIINVVDAFLRAHDQQPIKTVANTIFPQSLYEEFGYPKFMDQYTKSFDAIARKGWGRYFERMVSHTMQDGTMYNPLACLVEKLRSCENGRVHKAAFDLAIYDPLHDSRMLRGGQCLSYISFKRHPNSGLLMTAVYRNQHYVTKLMGNLLGLSWLQGFVANEVGISVGSLTCISTRAEIDKVSGKWGTGDVSDLLAQVNASSRGGNSNGGGVAVTV